MTRTAFTSAIPSTNFARRLGIAAFLCMSVSALGQRRRPTTAPATAGPAAPALWDTLYSEHRLFELRDSVRAWRGAPAATTDFYTGIVARAFNDNDRAIAALAPLLVSTSPKLAQYRFIAAVDALSDSYRRVFQYRESVNAYRAALTQRRINLDTAARSRFTSWATIDETLATVSPLRVTWSDVARNAAVANDSIDYAIAAGVNGDTLRVPLAVDVSAPLSMLDDANAARLGVRILNDSIDVKLSGGTVTARIGVIDRLDIGSAHIDNVVVLVVPATTIRTAYGDTRLGGVLGRRVLSALGSITFLRDGHIALSSPGADPDTSGLSNLALTGAGALVETIWQNKRVPLLLDAHARQTLLYPGFLRVFSGATADARLTTYVGRAGNGEVVSLPSYLIPRLSLTVANNAINLVGIHALMRDSDPRATRYLGTLGQDALRTADRITLDFIEMTVRFRPNPTVAVLPRIVYPSGTDNAAAQVGKVPEDIAFVVLLFALFVIPKALQRYRLASAVTSLIMGAGATAVGLFHNDPTLHLLSTFGIVALFLFAGLEIDAHELKRQASPLILHGLVWSVMLAIGAAVTTFVFGFAVRPALLIALALLTPSTGFILSSLAGFGLLDSERFAVKTYAIASELLALMVLFFALQSTSALHLAIAVAAMLGVVTVIPLAFRLFARIVAPHAPRSEFAFLLMVAIVCAYATRRLGVYYLVGAFLVGIAAQRFRSELPAMSSEKMVDALESFGSVFIPFYFFHAGTQIVREQLTLRAILIGLALVILLVPLRVALTMLQRRFVLKDSRSAARRIGISLIPTLVFTLVITDILNTEFGVEQYILGALVLYTVINTSIPAFALHSAPPEFENVGAADVEPADG